MINKQQEQQKLLQTKALRLEKEHEKTN